VIVSGGKTLNIENSTFSECSVPVSSGYGGAIYIYFNNHPNTFKLNGTINFEYNNAKIGRDIYINANVSIFICFVICIQLFFFFLFFIFHFNFCLSSFSELSRCYKKSGYI
jgi:hypothetical protein